MGKGNGYVGNSAPFLCALFSTSFFYGCVFCFWIWEPVFSFVNEKDIRHTPASRLLERDIHRRV